MGERYTILGLAYVGAFLVVHWLAFQFRFDFHVPEAQQPAVHSGWWAPLIIKVVCLLLFGQFTGLLGYFAIPDLWRVFYAMSVASLLILVAEQLDLLLVGLPRGVILIDYVMSTASVVGIRMGFRVMRERLRKGNGPRGVGSKRVGIIGAGDVGASLVKELLARRGMGLVPVAFFDDDPLKWHSQVHGVPVVGRPEKLRDPSFRMHLEEVIIAMPTAPAKRLGEVVRLLQGRASQVRDGTVRGPACDRQGAGESTAAGRDPGPAATRPHRVGPGQYSAGDRRADGVGHGGGREHWKRAVPTDCGPEPAHAAAPGPFGGPVVSH
ncbi:MAG: hypothetical protein M5U12_17950 [Verrucomicrobia bacterium]|nr:hypothetical protein [Verrucomicrobiota bacterium]